MGQKDKKNSQKAENNTTKKKIKTQVTKRLKGSCSIFYVSDMKSTIIVIMAVMVMMV